MSPDGRVQRAGAALMAGQSPAWPFIRQEIHVEDFAAAAGAEHCSLLLVAVFFNDIEHPLTQLRRELFDHDFGAVRRIAPVLPRPNNSLTRPYEPVAQPDEWCRKPAHVFRLSARSIRPSSGLVSPRPTFAPRISQIPSSGSVMISILARENVTLAKTSFDSSRYG